MGAKRVHLNSHHLINSCDCCITAVTDCDLLYLEQEDVLYIAGRNPELKERLVRFSKLGKSRTKSKKVVDDWVLYVRLFHTRLQLPRPQLGSTIHLLVLDADGKGIEKGEGQAVILSLLAACGPAWLCNRL